MCSQDFIPDSLLAEGRAMADALSLDLSAAEIEVDRMLDETLSISDKAMHSRLAYHSVNSAKEEKKTFLHLAASADWTVLIAPESDGALAERARWTLKAGGRLFGPNQEFIELTTDKQHLAMHLEAAGIEVPQGIAVAAGHPLPIDFGYPAVLKPRDGAGSQEVRLLENRDPTLTVPFEARLESYRPGKAVSVVILGGPTGLCPLPACTQSLSSDGQFSYLGGSVPLSRPHAERAEQLACRAVAACGTVHGYVGVDLILGRRQEEDCVIEINPRLTTSYLLLRTVAEGNLAQNIVHWRQGTGTSPSFAQRSTDFSLNLAREITV